VALGDVGDESIVITFGRICHECTRETVPLASRGAEVAHEAESLERLQVSGGEVQIVCSRRRVQADTRDEDPLHLDHAIGGPGDDI
jgi:hypothetical protein